MIWAQCHVVVVVTITLLMISLSILVEQLRREIVVDGVF
jgi:hypothetical protein